MGWLSSSKKTETTGTPLTREDRQQCWDSRDAYFSCLDKAGILKPGEEGKTCQSQKSGYEQSCAKSWVEYFNQRRLLAERQKRIDAQINAQQVPKSA